jgi:hypothetical protein
MNKKIKLFGFSATFLLISIALFPIVTSEPDPNSLLQELEIFADDHQEELHILENFFSTYDEIEEIPTEITSLMESLSSELALILEEYSEKPPVWKGMNSYWKSYNRVAGLHQYHPEWEYRGHCASINQFFTYTFITGILFGGWTAVFFLIFLISLIPWIGPKIAWILISLLWANKQEFIDWMMDIYLDNRYGVVFFWFITDESRFFWDQDHDKFQQLDHQWIPEEYYDEPPKSLFNWYRVV